MPMQIQHKHKHKIAAVQVYLVIGLDLDFDLDHLACHYRHEPHPHVSTLAIGHSRYLCQLCVSSPSRPGLFLTGVSKLHAILGQILDARPNKTSLRASDDRSWPMDLTRSAVVDTRSTRVDKATCKFKNGNAAYVEPGSHVVVFLVLPVSSSFLRPHGTSSEASNGFISISAIATGPNSRPLSLVTLSQAQGALRSSWAGMIPLSTPPRLAYRYVVPCNLH
ncbi:hypothetical protein Cob_v001224 [Colletotrichum orbiculare MAFF 240422]|uniref:Uncharacterized protein n=1 Tax=Colletotrichum orbiculare (strain 104-T / ATCC 96160 / CBS 514.97 / LARS 414 / MAFF 240422) TaxID=1213857 RepID=A0A484G872_COLOR|nr:hypothetical protein Cob_v001224 [Colletotrichum orbiculare MAFF 240422]